MTTKEEKRMPIAGSPITIGGGAGVEVKKLTIKVIANDWIYDANKGTLTLKDGSKRVKRVKVEANDVVIKVPVNGVPKIEIRYK